MNNAVLTERIRQIHAESDETYGMPRVRAELRDQGMAVSRKRVARLMRKEGLQGVSRRRAYIVTTRRNERQRPAPDLVQRRFQSDSPDALWVADMIYGTPSQPSLPAWGRRCLSMYGMQRSMKLQ